MTARPLSVIDLFAGCGGLSEGFEASPRYKVAAYVEWEKSPCRTLANRLRNKWGSNNPESRIVRFDIQKTDELLWGWSNCPEYGSGKGLVSTVGRNQVDMIIGGPPCQAYSVAGRIRDEFGMQRDYRNYLFESYLQVVRHYQPKLIVMENVTGMLSAAPGGVPVVERIATAFDDAGYEILTDLRQTTVDMTQYGIPQRRKRVVIVGLSRKAIPEHRQSALADFYGTVLPGFNKPLQTVNDAIGHLPPLYPKTPGKLINGRKYSHEPQETGIANHVPRYHNLRDIDIFRELARDAKSKRPRYNSAEDLQKLYTARTGKSSSVHKYYVLRSNEPANTIPAHLYKDGLRHIHPDPRQARSITVREAAALQSFPDDFEFLGSMGDQYKMIGNAVPPGFSHSLAIALADLFYKL
ncbi:MAG: DNA cytosine methyltransferase [Planctomycetota bacterium]|nr:DNA cytosine methyltransferase [Planctomycetota bacterium]